MNRKPIPYYVDPPGLSPSLIDEITDIIFGEPVDPKPCDLIHIFGGSHPGLRLNGAEAYFKGYGKYVVVTGGYKQEAIRHHSWMYGKTPESVVIRRVLVQMGIPEENIFSETQSTNTYENVRFALEIYDFGRVSRLMVVCKSYAAGRQIRTLQAQLDPDVEIIPYPFDTHLGGDGPFITRENWIDYQEGRAYMFANLLKIVQYGWAGHLVPVDGVSDEFTAVVQNFFEDEEQSHRRC